MAEVFYQCPRESDGLPRAGWKWSCECRHVAKDGNHRPPMVVHGVCDQACAAVYYRKINGLRDEAVVRCRKFETPDDNLRLEAANPPVKKEAEQPPKTTPPRITGRVNIREVVES